MSARASTCLAALFVAAAPCAAVAQERPLGNGDLAQIRDADEALFARDYKGRRFAAVMPFSGITENPFLRGRYTISFGNGLFVGDVSCAIADDAQAFRASDFGKGDLVGLRGIVEDHAMGSVVLKDCAFLR